MTMTLRPMRPDDAQAVERLITSLSPISAYRRFLGSSRSAGVAYLSRLRSPSQTLAATVAFEHGALVGIASLHPENERGAAEVALAVADADQGEGIGTLLLEDLVDDAQRLGLERLTATVLTDNAAMMTVFRDLGLTVNAGRADAGVIDVSLDLSVSAAFAERVAERDLTSSAASYRRAMHPEAVVVMHDARGRKTARGIQRHLTTVGYSGPVTVRESHLPVPAHTDLAVLCGLPRSVGRMVSACADAEVAAVLWPQAPFVSERHQESLRQACARAGLILLGPASRFRGHPDSVGLLAAGAGERADGGGGGVVVVGARPEHLVKVLERQGVEVGAVLDLSWEDLPDWSGAVAAALLEARSPAVVVCRPPLHALHWPPGLLNAVRQAGTLVVSLAPPAEPGQRQGPDGTVGFTRASDVAAMLSLGPGLSPRPGDAAACSRPSVLVVGDAAAARSVRDACAARGVLAARLTEQAERRLRLTTPLVVVDDNALCWDNAPVSGLRSVLDTVLDCPDVDVVVVALDEPRTQLDQNRYLDLEREAAQVGGGARLVACVPGVGVPRRLPTFSSATACAEALALLY